MRSPIRRHCCKGKPLQCKPPQVFKLVTKPDMDRFVPKRLQHYLPGGGLEYTDIIRYDPQLLEKPPFKLVVHSIPPVFQKKVRKCRPADVCTGICTCTSPWPCM